MSIKAVLFDLDATLLPMNQDKFIEKYFAEISTYLNDKCGYEPKSFLGAMWLGIKDMITNDGRRTNENAFWERLSEIYGKERIKRDMPVFEQFYEECFDRTKAVCGYTKRSREVVDYLKSRGITVVLATNPVFPAIATEMRMGWVDLKPQDFALVTTYENIGYCKPNPKYYTEIAKRIGVSPSECLMVGNDTSDDLSASVAGMSVFLLTDCLINTNDVDITKIPNGSFDELFAHIEKLI